MHSCRGSIAWFTRLPPQLLSPTRTVASGSTCIRSSRTREIRYTSDQIPQKGQHNSGRTRLHSVLLTSLSWTRLGTMRVFIAMIVVCLVGFVTMVIFVLR
jgi:hypothetical protein